MNMPVGAFFDEYQEAVEDDRKEAERIRNEQKTRKRR